MYSTWAQHPEVPWTSVHSAGSCQHGKFLTKTLMLHRRSDASTQSVSIGAQTRSTALSAILRICTRPIYHRASEMPLSLAPDNSKSSRPFTRFQPAALLPIADRDQTLVSCRGECLITLRSTRRPNFRRVSILLFSHTSKPHNPKPTQ